MEAIYAPSNVTPAYQLNWGLTIFWRDTPILDANWFVKLAEATEPDGVRVLKHRFIAGGASQFFISTKPAVAPSALIRSVKGRLQYLIRKQTPKPFQRNYCLRSIGQSKRSIVQEYVANQLGHHTMADAAVQERFTRYQRTYADIDLSQPCFSSHGEFWNNLHLVLVNQARWAEVREKYLDNLIAMVERTAEKYSFRLSRVGLLADHMHATLGGGIYDSPENVALSVMNNCAFVYGMKQVFSFSYYVGTIGEYDRGAVP